uniref:CS domain-containing protein n=2 Tax=Cannabis sativa TaxID=3483 RepID=A0A803PRB5_CANSA
MATSFSVSLLKFSQNPNTTTTTTTNTLSFLQPNHSFSFRPTNPYLPRFFTTNDNGNASFDNSHPRFSRSHGLSSLPLSTNHYEHMQFFDNSSEVELRVHLKDQNVRSSKDVFVDANETSLTIRALNSGSPTTLIEANRLFDRVKPAETIWLIDDDQLVVILKKQDPDLKWPDIMESWESLTVGSSQLLKGASIYIVGESTNINQQVAKELAVGIGYTPFSTKELLENFSKQTIDSWVLSEGSDSVAEAESAILESLSSHVRTVVATLGGQQGTSRRADKWRHLHAGFTVWLSQTEAIDEESAKEEAKKHVQDGGSGYSKADVVVKFQGCDTDHHAKSLAQACLSALKQLILADKKLPGKKSLYIRLGCRGDWPNIKPPGWDPSSAGDGVSPATL